jgi:signal transduction histidine kinase
MTNESGEPRAAQLSGWLASRRLRTLPLDLGLAGITILTVITRAVIPGFHVMFIIVILAALMLPFRGFAIRFAVWMGVSTALLVWAVTSLDVSPDELAEIPILAVVLVLVFLVAQARARAAAESRAANDELLRRTELESRELRQQLEQAQRRDLIGRASAGLSHDLRNVFSVIKGCTAEAAEKNVGWSDPQRSCLDEVGAAADRGVAILDELLWLGRQHDSILQVTDLSTSIRQLEPLLRRLTRRGVVLRFDIPERECLVRVDRIGLSQILMNLVSNANDAIVGNGNITVSVRPVITSSTRADGPTAVLTVTDDGRGFTSDELSAAFEAGFTTKGDGHFGLGLSTVWDIVDRCGGSMQIDSSPDDVTTISILFESPDATAGPSGDSDADASFSPSIQRAFP